MAAYNLRTSKSTDDLSNEEIVSETQQIWGNKEWLTSIDTFCSMLINKNKPGRQEGTTPPSPTANNPPPTPTNKTPNETNPPSTLKDSTSTHINPPVDPSVETPIPSDLKELCSLDLGKGVSDFFLALEFVASNLKYVNCMKELELHVLDYVITKETMDPA